MDSNYELRQFHVTENDLDEPGVQLRAWRSAVARGFNEPEPTRQQVQRTARTALETGAVLTEVFAAHTSPDSRIAKLPSATFARFPGQVNVGAQRLVPASFVSEVTVQSRHKRRGILTEMMTLNLEQAAGEGTTLAVLTASSGALYGRYGFHNVTEFTEAKLKPQPDFQLGTAAKELAKQGTVEPVTLSWLAGQADAIYLSYLNRYRGATTRYPTYFEDGFYAPHADAPSPKYLAAVHIATDGAYDGYAIYSVFRETVMRVAEVVAASLATELALWDYLTNIELIETLYYPHFTTLTPLRLALADARSIEVTGTKDGLWARVLDAKVALESRPYMLTAADNTVSMTIRVEDPLQIAAGSYHLSVCADRAHVEALRYEDGLADMTVGPRALAALTFGAALPSELRDAGLLTVGNPELLPLADLLFHPVGPAGFLSEF